MIKVGIIGLGFMGHTHYQIYKQHKDATIVAIADHRESRLRGEWWDIGGNIGDMERKREDLSGINTYKDPYDLINDPNVELVDICMPTDLHKDLAIAALKAGKHVFLEKPMARTAEEAKELLNVANRAKTFFMVGHCIRFWPEYEVTYKLIKSGKYGKVKEVFLRRVANPPTFADQNWFMKGKRSGGAILDLHIHDVDYILYLLGKPKKIWAWGDKGPSGMIDVVYSSYEYPNNVHASIIGGWVYHAPFPFNMEFCIRTEKATFVYDMLSGSPLKIYTDRKKELIPKLPEGTGWSREIDYFLKCIKSKKKPEIVTARSSYESIVMVEKELESIQTKKAVDGK